jgi:hypothetical protein
MFSNLRARRFPLALLVLVLGSIAACDDDPTEPEDPAEDLAVIRLSIGGQQVNITEGAGGSVTIPLGATAVSATFLDAAGLTLDLGSAFELRLNSTNTARVTFTRSGPFAGSLNGLTAGNAVVEVVLWHIEEQHEDFGPQNLTVTVQ